MNELMKIVQPAEIAARERIAEINAMPVKTRADFDVASEWLKAVANFEKQIKAKEKEAIAPHKAIVDEIKANFKKPLDILAEAQTTARGKINAFLLIERRALEEQARKDMAERQKQAEKELKKLDRADKRADKFDDVTANAVREMNADKRSEIIAAANKETEINQSNINSSVRMIWDFKTVDIKSVPAEFLQINATAVRDAIKNGVREISGLKIFQKPTIAIK